MDTNVTFPHRSALLIIAVLCVLAYLPAFHLSFISDDYAQIQMSRALGEPGGYWGLIADPAERLRMTFFFVSYFLDKTFGLNATAFHTAMVVLHVIVSWMVYALAVWPMVGRKKALLAAGFFAVYEGHQEAVMWYSGLMETLVCLFGLAALAAFIAWLRGKGWTYYALALLCYAAALVSKESAYVFAGLMLLPMVQLSYSQGNWKPGLRYWLGWLPFAASAGVCVVWLAMNRLGNGRFQDGSFSLTPRFFLVLPDSLGRLLFVWGLLAIAGLVLLKARNYWQIGILSFIWMIVGLVPYCFLTYMTRVPSRHTYLASVGLSLLVAAAMMAVWKRFGGKPVLALAAIILIVNAGILWKKKAAQYQARALPTDTLISAIRFADGPIHIKCYPYLPIVAESAAREFNGSVVFEKSPDLQHQFGARCLDIWYKDVTGNVREVFIPPARLP